MFPRAILLPIDRSLLPTELDAGRFLEAQEQTYRSALIEVRAGRKRGCWSWYIIPQLAGAQSSGTSIQYAIADERAAREYLEHPVLGSRLIQIAEACLRHPTTTADQVFGLTDAEKLHQCLTLFDHVAPDGVFGRVLDQWFSGERDVTTRSLLAGRPTSPAR